MDLTIIATGILVGITLAAPVGPINLMCMQRALQFGFLSGLATGIGAALGDGVFAAVTAFGLTWVTRLIEGNIFWLQGFGGILLVIIGIRTMLAPPADLAPAEPGWVHHGGLIGTTFLLTVTNPATLIGFVAIFSGIGGMVAGKGDFAAMQLVGAVILGSFLWWVSVARIVSWFRHRLTSDRLALINRISGTIILLFGAAVLFDLAAGGVITSALE